MNGRPAILAIRAFWTACFAACLLSAFAAEVRPVAAAPAKPAHHRRGPKLAVIRQSLDEFPDHVRYGEAGSITVTSVSAAAWDGSGRLGDAPADPGNQIVWTAPRVDDWEQLRLDELSRFEAAKTSNPSAQ